MAVPYIFMGTIPPMLQSGQPKIKMGACLNVARAGIKEGGIGMGPVAMYIILPHCGHLASANRSQTPKELLSLWGIPHTSTL